MKITIIASSVFAKQMVEYQKKLRNLWHIVELHKHYIEWAAWWLKNVIDRINTEHSQLKIENDYIRYHYNEIVNSDAVLVLNFDKNNVINYIGANTFLEIWFAHVHHKKVFLLNSIPEQKYINDELLAVEPIIINNDLSLIK
jgi:hypothetical protein